MYMTREEELKQVKEVIKEHIDWGTGGIFNCSSWCGDKTITIFSGKNFKVNHCEGYLYFDIFGTTEAEFKALEVWYEKLVKEYRNAWEDENGTV